MTKSRRDEINKLELHEAADLLGIGLTPDRRHLASCPACGASKHGSAKVFVGKKAGHHRWHCRRCDEGGGVADLAALTMFDAWWRDLDSEQRDEVASAVLDEAPTTTATKRPRAYPPSPPSVANIGGWDQILSDFPRVTSRDTAQPGWGCHDERCRKRAIGFTRQVRRELRRIGLACHSDILSRVFGGVYESGAISGSISHPAYSESPPA